LIQQIKSHYKTVKSSFKWFFDGLYKAFRRLPFFFKGLSKAPFKGGFEKAFTTPFKNLFKRVSGSLKKSQKGGQGDQGTLQ
jgi:hypothetical protein